VLEVLRQLTLRITLMNTLQGGGFLKGSVPRLTRNLNKAQHECG
jgi:hypothetical protein